MGMLGDGAWAAEALQNPVVLLTTASGAALLALTVGIWIYCTRSPEGITKGSPLWDLGVRPTYDWPGLPSAKIDAYVNLKESLRERHVAKGSSDTKDDSWMSQIPRQDKELLKYHLMQRAIGDMAVLRKIDSDARGYWRLFTKGIITQMFWKSVVEVEHEVSYELEEVKHEAASLEPTQDPQSIITEAMQWLFRFGDKLPPDPAPGQNPLEALLGNLPGGLPPGGLPGMPGMPEGFPMGPRAHPQHGGPMQPAPAGPPPDARGPPEETPGSSGAGTSDVEGYSWRQDSEDVEVTCVVKSDAKKNEVRVVIKVQELRVELAGEVVCEGKLAARCEPEGSTWTLSKGRIVCSLAKADPKPWPCLFVKA